MASILVRHGAYWSLLEPLITANEGLSALGSCKVHRGRLWSRPEDTTLKVAHGQYSSPIRKQEFRLFLTSLPHRYCPSMQIEVGTERYENDLG